MQMLSVSFFRFFIIIICKFLPFFLIMSSFNCGKFLNNDDISNYSKIKNNLNIFKSLNYLGFHHLLSKDLVLNKNIHFSNSKCKISLILFCIKFIKDPECELIFKLNVCLLMLVTFHLKFS